MFAIGAQMHASIVDFSTTRCHVACPGSCDSRNRSHVAVPKPAMISPSIAIRAVRAASYASAPPFREKPSVSIACARMSPVPTRSVAWIAVVER